MPNPALDFLPVDYIVLSPEDIIPNGTRILIKRRPAQQVTKGNIIIPESAQYPDYIAKVLAVGPDVERFQPGDWVVVGLFNAIRFKLTDNADAPTEAEASTEYTLVDQEDIWALVTKDLPEE